MMCEIVKQFITTTPCYQRSKDIKDWCYECRGEYDVVFYS